MMRFSELRYFLAVVETGSFGKAAQALGLQVSTVSRAVARLEDNLGITLIERTPIGVRATSSGQIAARQIRRVLIETNALSETLRRSGAGETGEIHLGFQLPPINADLVALLLDWRVNNPAVRIVPYEPVALSLHAALMERQIDVAVVPDFLLHRYEINVPVYYEHLTAALPANHRLAGASAVKWTDLKGENLLLWLWGKDGVGEDFFATRMPRASLTVFEASNTTVLAFVRADFGVTVAASIYSTLNLPKVTFVPIDEDDAQVEMSLVWRPISEDPVVGRFVAFMRDRAQARLKMAPYRSRLERPIFRR